MPLDLESELESAQEAYLENAGYTSSGSLAEARAFAVACRKLLHLMPKFTRQGARFEVEHDPKVLQAEMNRAEEWADRQTGSGPSQISLERYRC